MLAAGPACPVPAYAGLQWFHCTRGPPGAKSPGAAELGLVSAGAAGTIVPNARTFVILKELLVREFHHIGIPVPEKTPEMGCFESIKCWATDPENTPGRVEYIYFEPKSPMTEPVLSETHVAFRVDDLDEEIKDKECVVGPMTLPEGVKIAFFYRDGCLTEFHQILG